MLQIYPYLGGKNLCCKKTFMEFIARNPIVFRKQLIITIYVYIDYL